MAPGRWAQEGPEAGVSLVGGHPEPLQVGMWLMCLCRATPGPQPWDSPMGPRLGPAAEVCGGAWPTSWLTEGSLLTPTCALLMGERTGP